MKKFNKYILFLLFVSITFACKKNGDQVKLGDLKTGNTVYFTCDSTGEWGIEITGNTTPQLMQEKPVFIEVYRKENDKTQFSVGYTSIKKSKNTIVAESRVNSAGDVFFHIEDQWSISDDVLKLNRKISVEGEESDAGFSSAFQFQIDQNFGWEEAEFFLPAALYGDPTHDGDFSPGGIINNKAKRFVLREDQLPAPVLGISFNNASSLAIMSSDPDGESTLVETTLRENIMIDERFKFASLGVWQEEKKPMEFGFMFPGKTTTMRFRGSGMVGREMNSDDLKPNWIYRYNPVSQNIEQNYEVSFRFGGNVLFREMVRDSWRWAWETLKPEVAYQDIEEMRKILLDHLQDRVAHMNGRTAVPFVEATYDTTSLQWNYTMVAMGFVGKNLECAEQFLIEADRDKTERGEKMRESALNIISSMIQSLNKIPLEGTGYDLATGKYWDHQWVAPWLRNASEDMTALMKAYKRELAQGREHPEWLEWVKRYVDWLILQQNEDGSFPRRWERGTSVVAEATGTTSYAPVPLLLIMTELIGDPKYEDSGIRAAEYIWENYGSRGLYVGGASDNPNITDKEAGMLSLEAFLSIYESTNDSKWLERAKAAADFAGTWMWIWELPLPDDAKNSQLFYKKGVSTIGPQAITAMHVGAVDEYLDWSAPSYAKLYKLTGEQHYLDVARILLHNTKQMVAMPGRLYDYKGIGWQQEGFSFGPGRSGRGKGGHRFWLPWVSANHLVSITGLEELDPVLFNELTKGD